MKIELKVSDILAAVDAIVKFCEQQLPFHVALQLKKDSAQIMEAAKVFNDLKDGLIRQHGSTDEGGNVTINKDTDPDNFKACVDAINEHASAVVSLDIKGVSIDDLPKSAMISTQNLNALMNASILK